MSNSNRNPKELKNLVEKGKLIIDGEDDEDFENQMEKSIKNLKHLAQEEKTEMGMLKSRIDEQSRIIMMLKQRCDEFIRKNLTLEKFNQEIISKQEEIESREKSTRFKCTQIESRFAQLNQNHEELIKIKNEYKEKLNELTEQNRRLNEKMKNMVNEDQSEKEKIQLVEKINDLNQIIKENKKNFTEHMKKNDQHITELKEFSARNENLQNQKIFYLNNKVEEYRKQIDGSKKMSLKF
jgi:hypothetical protein